MEIKRNCLQYLPCVSPQEIDRNETINHIWMIKSRILQLSLSAECKAEKKIHKNNLLRVSSTLIKPTKIVTTTQNQKTCGLKLKNSLSRMRTLLYSLRKVITFFSTSTSTFSTSTQNTLQFLAIILQNVQVHKVQKTLHNSDTARVKTAPTFYTFCIFHSDLDVQSQFNDVDGLHKTNSYMYSLKFRINCVISVTLNSLR